jgi:hypothetical protein
MDPERHTCTWKNAPVTLTVTLPRIWVGMAPRGAHTLGPVRLGLPTFHVKAWHFIPPSHLPVFHK